MTSARLRRFPLLTQTVAGAVVGLTLALAMTVGGERLGAGLFAPAMLVIAVIVLVRTPPATAVALLIVYLGVVDGPFKLATGSNLAYIGRDILIIAVLMSSLSQGETARPRLRNVPGGTLFVVYAAVVLVQLAHPNNVIGSFLFAAVRPHLEFVPLFFLGYVTITTRERLRMVVLVFGGVALANSIAALIQFNFTPDQLASLGPGYKRLQEDQAFTTALRTNEFIRPPALGPIGGYGGFVAAFALPGLLALVSAAHSQRHRIYAVMTVAGCLAAVITAQSRTAVVFAVVSVGAYFALTLRSRQAALTALGILALLSVSGVLLATGSGTSRERFRASEFVTGNPLQQAREQRGGQNTIAFDQAVRAPLGIGLGRVGQVAARSPNPAENESIESEMSYAILELGIPGLVTLFALAVMFIRLGLRAAGATSGDQELRTLLAALTAVQIAILVGWTAGPVLVTAPGAPLFWLFGGILATWARKLSVQPGASPEPVPPPTPPPEREAVPA